MRQPLLFFVLLLAGVKIACAQDRDADFLTRARIATEKYQNQSTAILDGYRPIGSDFPGMGVHWVRIGLLFDSTIEAEHPEFLIYISVSGIPKLVGVAYAIPLLPGESAPDVPAGKEAWHDHFRSIEDETIVPQHHHHIETAENEPRLTMLHAWIWVPNPDGVYAADNWAIPYIRFGLTPPADATTSMALALSLLSGGVEYFSMMIDAAASPNSKQRKRINSAFDRARSDIERTVRENNLYKLTAIWNELWKTIGDSIGSQAKDRLQAVAVP
jgi:hypothetical protein